MEQYVIKNQSKLRCGVTTGSCAAAAAEAAAALLLLGIRRERVSVYTPKEITLDIEVRFTGETPDMAEFMVVKDSGDDPDVTNQAEIYVRVERLSDGVSSRSGRVSENCFTDDGYPGLFLDGGVGIGRVMKEGLEQRIGQAAINAVPRQMIFRAVDGVRALAEYEGELLITVSIPEGVSLARRTFNPRLGIEGGLSVLGTTGILEPMSERAIIDTIEAEIRQRYNQGKRSLLVAPGNYGQRYVSEYLKLNLEDGIKCSNYIGDTLDLAVAYGMKELLLVGNIGKLVKLAAGIMNTHSRAADGRCEVLAVHTVLCGGTEEMVRQIMQCVGTEDVLRYLTKWGLREQVIGSVCDKIYEHVKHRVGDAVEFGVMLFSERYGYLGETKGSSDIAGLFR